MATQSAPSTPKAAAAAAPVSEGSGTPGKWRHPQLNEIVRRQNAATLGDKDVKRLLWNGAALVTSWFFGNTFKTYTRLIFENKPFYQELSLLLLQLFFALNIFMALYPLYRPKDNLSDIPLTPTQRALLGLDPTATPSATPGTTYVTPPRYRMSTSRKASPVSRQTSPLSATPTLSERRVSSGSSFSPASSPLFHKAVANGGRETSRRQSFGSSSPLARSNSFGESSIGSSIGPSSPSPLGGKRSTLGVSNRWLYERSRRLSASNGAH